MAFFACGTHIEQKPKRLSRLSQVDVVEMQSAACSLLEVLSGNELSCSSDLLAATVELQLSIYQTSNPILDVCFVHRVSLARGLEYIVPPAVLQRAKLFEDGMIYSRPPERLPMNYANIKYFDIADGEGVRTSLFVSGCRRGCKNCFNSVAWDFAAGEPFDRAVEDKIIESLDHPFIDGLTILGGEPMEPENQAGLVEFVERVRAAYPVGSGKTIWCFTGDVLEELMPGGRHHTEVTDRILACLDMLVDGPFVQDLYDISLRFRGSSNQRVIDMNATRARAEREGVALCDAVELWRDDPVYSTHTM